MHPEDSLVAELWDSLLGAMQDREGWTVAKWAEDVNELVDDAVRMRMAEDASARLQLTFDIDVRTSTAAEALATELTASGYVVVHVDAYPEYHRWRSRWSA